MSLRLSTPVAPSLPPAIPVVQPTSDPLPVPPEKRLQDISVTDAVQGLAGGVFNSFLGAGGVLGSTLWHTKDAVINGYKALKVDNHIGPNVKALVRVLGIPGAAILLQPLAAVGGAVYGLGQGFYTGALKGFLQSVNDTWDGIETYDKYAAQGVDFLKAYEPDPLPDGKIPWDMTFSQSAHAFAGGVTSPFILGGATAGITFWRQWKGYYRALESIWREEGNIVWRASLMGLATLALPLATPLALSAGAFWGLGEGIIEGYENGVVAAWQQSLDRVRQYNKWTKEMVEEPWS